MKLITRDTDYALRALCYLACRDGRITPVSTLTRELKVPRPFLRKLLQILHRRKILKAFKGKEGGFCLAVKPSQLHLLDIIEIFQGSLKLNECLLRKRTCPNVTVCPLRRRIRGVEEELLMQLGVLSLASLARQYRRSGMC